MIGWDEYSSGRREFGREQLQLQQIRDAEIGQRDRQGGDQARSHVSICRRGVTGRDGTRGRA